MRRRELLAALGTLALSSGPVQLERAEPTVPLPSDDSTTPISPGQDGANSQRGLDIPRREIPFERELDVVSDLGVSPEDDQPCNEQLSAALGDDVLFRFPPGRYEFDDPLVVQDVDRIGLVGADSGAVQFVPREGFNSQLVNVSGVGEVDFRNITIDVASPATTAGLRFITRNGFRVENVTYRGRGAHPANEVTNAFYLAVENPDAWGVLRNAVARKGSAIGHYKRGNGRAAVWIGPAHRGTAYVENCEFAEFGNNGLYTSRNTGNVRVHGGTFRNNNVAAVRISGEGSYVTGARIEVDTSDYSGPRTRLDAAFKTRGVVVEQGPFDEPPGVFVRDCTIDLRASPNPGPAISVWPTGKTVTVVDSSLRADGDTGVVYRHSKTRQNDLLPSKGARGVALSGVEIDGTSSNHPMVVLEDAPGSVFHECHVRQAHRNRDGVALVRSPRTLFDGGSISAGRYPITLDVDFSSVADCLMFLDRPPALRTGVDTDNTDWVPLESDVQCRTLQEGSSQGATATCNFCLAAAGLRPLDEAIDLIGITQFRNQQVGLHYP